MAKLAWGIVKRSLKAWSDDYAQSMGAAISYYTLFSIAPLLIIVIAIAGLVLGRDVAESRVLGQLGAILGPDAARTIATIVDHARRHGHGIWAAVGGLVTLLVGATSVVSELQSALDRIWRTPAKDKRGGIWGIVRQRLLSFSLILGFVFLLLVSLAISAALAALTGWWGGGVHRWKWVLEIVNDVVSFGVITGLFALIYKLLPRERIGWRDVWVGSLVTAALFTPGKFLIGLYIGKTSTASAYGAAGSLIVLLLWVYYSAQIFLLGAEFTWVFAYATGSRKGQPVPGSLRDPAKSKGKLEGEAKTPTLKPQAAT